MAELLTPLVVAPIPRITLRLEEAAEALSVSSRTLHKWAMAGEVPSVVIGGVRLFPVSALTAEFDRLAERAATTPEGANE